MCVLVWSPVCLSVCLPCDNVAVKTNEELMPNNRILHLVVGCSMGIRHAHPQIPNKPFWCFWFQGETPKQHAERADDQELADYLENRQHYEMIQREDQETAV